jgi:hypothetical protein
MGRMKAIVSRWWLAAGIAMLAGAGCGSAGARRGEAGTDGVDAGSDAAPDGGQADLPDDLVAPATVAEACTALAQAQAAFSARCFGGALPDWQTFVGRQLDCSVVAQHVQEGTEEYRPSEWTPCMRELMGPCEAARSGSCPWAALPGRVAEGQPCSDSHVCGVDAFCSSVTDDACANACVRMGRENEPCGFYCGGTTPCAEIAACGAGLVCHAGQCVKSPTQGPCDPADGPAACGAGYACFYSAALDMAGCGPRPTVHGGICQNQDQCLPDEFCLLGFCTPRKAAGEACANVADGGCAAWTRCDPDSARCVHAGLDGEPCSDLYGLLVAAFCAEGTCVDGRCRKEIAVGGVCGEPQCALGSSCNAATLRCEACPGR